MISTPVFAQNASESSVKELLSITKSEQMINQAQNQIMPLINSSIEQATKGKDLNSKQKQALENYQKDIANIIAQDFTWSKMEADMIKIYAENFTQNEIDDMIKFYKTPSGQSTIEKLPIVMDKSMQIGFNQMMALTPKFDQATEKFKREMAKAK